MVEPSPRFPGGVKYSFTYVRSDGLRLRRHYGIDNAHGGPPHEHVGPETHELADMTIDAVRARFRAQVTALRRRGP